MKCLTRLILLILFLGITAPGIADEKKIPLRDAPEWIQLSRIWRQMSEHWIGKVVSREQFESLEPELEKAVSLLINLQARKYFDAGTRESIEKLCFQRYAFIREQRYRLHPFIVMTDLDSHAFMARSRIEDSLAKLLWPPAEVEDILEAKKKWRKDLAVQLEFLRRCVEVQELISYHRAKAQEKEEKGSEVDWNQFQLEAYRQTRGLIDDYISGRIEPSEEILRLRDHLLSLTEEPLPPPEARIES